VLEPVFDDFLGDHDNFYPVLRGAQASAPRGSRLFRLDSMRGLPNRLRGGA